MEAAPAQPEEPVSKPEEPVDHEPVVEEPAKPQGELIPLVEPPTAELEPEVEPEPEVIVQQEEENETELIDGGENQANIFPINLPCMKTHKWKTLVLELLAVERRPVQTSLV